MERISPSVSVRVAREEEVVANPLVEGEYHVIPNNKATALGEGELLYVAVRYTCMHT